MNESFVRLHAVTKRHDDRMVMADVSFEVAEGELLALLGPSGCGKTTTLRVIAGLETPDAGEIWIAGRRVTADGRNVVPPRARGIGFVFQDLALWPHMTVRGSLNFVLASSGLPKAERADRIADVLRLMHATVFADRYPNQLSGGEQQRAALARALVAHPRLLLLDEPVSSLDSELKFDLLHELTSLQQQVGVTTIYVTHDKSEADALTNRVAFMREGYIQPLTATERLATDQREERNSQR
jgi:ABC-type Fe3+/spermidine/putrescine transport system ATPase subunit